jgi:polar amino acid transport system substrate-binding protein
MDRSQRYPQGRGRYVRQGRPLAVALSGLGLVAAVLFSTVMSVAGDDDLGGSQSVEGAGGTDRRAPSGHQAAGPAADPKPETCANGKDPARSLKPSSKAGPAVERIKDRGRLVVGVDQNSYLWGYRDPTTGQIDGFDIDLVRAIAEDLLGDDAKVTYKTIPTDQRIPAIKNGDVDMVVRTMTVNCERIKEVAFSTAYFEAGQQLVVPKGSKARGERVTGFDESLRGKRLCFAEGSTAQTLMQRGKYQKLGAEPVVVANQLDCLVRLQLGHADATLTDSALGAGQAAQDPTVELVGDPVTVEPYGVAMNLDDEDLVRRVNSVLDAYIEGGDSSRWHTSYEKWLADDIIGTDDGKELSPPKPKYRD